MNGAFLLFAGICFLCYAVRTAYNVLNYRKHPLAGSKVIVNSVYAVMGVLWFSWFQMCFTDPWRESLSERFRYAGLISFVVGVVLIIISHVGLRGAKDRGRLVTTGIYSRIRNPMYLGFILWIIGFPLFTRSLATLASGAVWISFILFWKILEEKSLANTCLEYAEYRKNTWF